MKKASLYCLLLVAVVAGTGCGDNGNNGDDNAPGNDTITGEDLVLLDSQTLPDTADRTDNAGVDDIITGIDTAGTDTTTAEDTATGGDTATGEDTTDPADTTVPEDTSTGDPDVTVEPIPFTCSTGNVIDGWNKGRSIAGKTRDFYVVLPENPDNKPVGVIFVFHGFGDNVDNFKAFFNPNPDADPDFPYVLVFPKSLALAPGLGGMEGLEWYILNSSAGDSNPDAMFFEEILGCLASTVTVDPGSVFAFGFSAGAIFTNLLHSRYPDILQDVLSMSGAWFNDDDTVDGVNTMGMATLSWDDMTDTTATVFMTHGGQEDTYGAMGITIIDFEQSAGYAVPFLNGHGRTVIDCPHTSGHTNHPEIANGDIIRFFKDHRGPGPSPYAGGATPSYLPSSCTIQVE